jgi:hypothetical protein
VNGSREPDQAVERLLRQSFKLPQGGVTDSCLDAETLAAWLDDDLSGAALDMAQSHVANCDRCQSLIATMVRTTDQVRPALAQAAPTRRRWIPWLFPLAAAAAAVAVWVAVPRDSGTPVPNAVDVRQRADAQASAPARLDRREPAGLDKQLEGRPARAPEGLAAAREAPSTTLAKRDEASRNQAQSAQLRKDAGRLEADRLEGRLADQTAQPVAVPAAAPPVTLEAQKAVQAPSANRLAGPAGIVIVSPDPSVRWRLVGSAVERSTNGGSQWDVVFSDAAVATTAGGAPSPLVCWVVGRGGLVLLSTDGRTFSRLAFPEVTDLSGVQATDAKSASVSTPDGRVFATADGGVTWHPR